MQWSIAIPSMQKQCMRGVRSPEVKIQTLSKLRSGKNSLSTPGGCEATHPHSSHLVGLGPSSDFGLASDSGEIKAIVRQATHSSKRKTLLLIVGGEKLPSPLSLVMRINLEMRSVNGKGAVLFITEGKKYIPFPESISSLKLAWLAYQSGVVAS